MTLLVSVALFILGAISASFAGVLAARLSTGQSFLFGRSFCDACAARLSPLALVPIVSYAISRGRSRCCAARLSPLFPLSEALLGALFVLAYAKLGLGLALPLVLLALSLLLALVLNDLAHQILPTPLLAVFVALSAAALAASAPSLSTFYDTLRIAVFIAAFLALIHFLSRGRAMGFADTPFAFGLALLTGPAAFPGLVFSFWIGACIGIALLLARPAGSRMSSEVPFAPFLAAGFLLAYFTQWNPFFFVAILP